MNHGLLKWFIISLAISPFSVAAVHPRPEPRIKLQWMDSAGSTVDLDWPARLRWVWRQGSENPEERSGVFAQLSIELPPQLSVELPAGSRARLLQPIEQSRSTLVIETQNPSVLESLEVGAEGASNSQAGLIVTLIPDAPQILLHSSCLKEGLRVDQIRGNANFLFLSANCRRDSKYLMVWFQTSHDVELVDANGKTVSRDYKMECLIPKKKEQTPFVGQLGAFHQVTGEINQYKVYWTGVSIHGAEASLLEDGMPQSSFVSETFFRDWSGSVFAGPSLLFYSESHAELAIRLDARAIHPLAEGVAFEGELDFPFLPVTRRPLMPLASGAYQLGMRARLAAKDFSFSPGLRAMGVHLANRMYAPGFLLGADASIEWKNLGVDHLMLQGGASLLGGGGESPLFHAFRVSGLTVYDLERWNLTGGFEYIKLGWSRSQPVSLFSIMAGIQFKF